jgi:hypothetical protein
MTTRRTHISALAAAGALAAGALAAGGIASADSPGGPALPRTALVIDASLARDGRDLIDSRLETIDAELRVPRSDREARTNVRYFDALGYRVVVAGRRSEAAAGATGIAASRATDIVSAVAATRR